jgi:hypothetical protein
MLDTEPNQVFPLFSGVRYHLNEWATIPSKMRRNCSVEHAFGLLKRIFKILDEVIPFSPFPTQVKIMIAVCIIHNWVIQDGSDEFIILETNELPSINHQISSHGQAMERYVMVNFRQ